MRYTINIPVLTVSLEPPCWHRDTDCFQHPCGGSTANTTAKLSYSFCTCRSTVNSHLVFAADGLSYSSHSQRELLSCYCEEMASAKDELEALVDTPVSGGRDPTLWLPDELMEMIFLVAPFETLWGRVCERGWHASAHNRETQ